MAKENREYRETFTELLKKRFDLNKKKDKLVIIMITIYLAPVIGLAIYFVIVLKKMEKHDNILYNFYQIRRDMMSYLRNNFENISKVEYSQLEKLLYTLNRMIHYYNDHKKTTFRLRIFIRHVRETKRSYNRVKKVPEIRNPKIRELYDEFGLVMLKAIIRYTPFVILKFVFYVSQASLHILKERVKDSSSRAVSFVKDTLWFKDQVQANNIKLRPI